MTKTRREKNSTPDTRSSPRHKRLYRTFLSSVLLTAALLALLHATPSAAHAAPLPQDTDDATLHIINDSDQIICYVYISPVTSDEWGDDWLGVDETIPPSESRAFDVAAGDYDVGLDDCDGNILLTEQALTIAGQHKLRYAPEPGTDSWCNALLQSGITLYRQANYQRAVQKFQDALTCYQEIDNRQGEGNSLGALGVAYGSLGQYTTAIKYHEQALAIARDIGDRQGEGNHLGNLGNVYESLGQYETAIEHHEQALAIARDIDDRQSEGNRLGNLGNARRPSSTTSKR
jgi:tetratricopeptide (TPR) repeat protein